MSRNQQQSNNQRPAILGNFNQGQNFQQPFNGQHSTFNINNARSVNCLDYNPTTIERAPILVLVNGEPVIPQNNRGATVYGYLPVYSAFNFKILSALWEHRAIAIDFLREQGKTDLKIDNKFFGNKSSTTSTTSSSENEILNVLKSLGFVPPQPKEPSPDDKLQQSILSTLQSLGVSIPGSTTSTTASSPATSTTSASPSNAAVAAALAKSNELEKQLNEFLNKQPEPAEDENSLKLKAINERNEKLLAALATQRKNFENNIKTKDLVNESQAEQINLFNDDIAARDSEIANLRAQLASFIPTPPPSNPSKSNPSTPTKPKTSQSPAKKQKKGPAPTLPPISEQECNNATDLIVDIEGTCSNPDSRMDVGEFQARINAADFDNQNLRKVISHFHIPSQPTAERNIREVKNIKKMITFLVSKDLLAQDEDED